MFRLSDLPADLLPLVLSHLELPDLLRFCATCRFMRHVFQPNSFVALLQYYDTRSPLAALAIGTSSHLLLCHALCKLFRRHGPQEGFKPLLARGASFGDIPAGELLKYEFNRWPKGRADYMIQHGASFSQIPGGGVNQLFLNTFERTGASPQARFILNHVHVDQIPVIHELLKKNYLNYGLSGRVDFLLEYGASFNLVSGGINQVLEETFVRHGSSSSVDFLLQNGAELTQVPCGLQALLEKAFRLWGPCTEVKDLCALGATFDTDSLHCLLHDEYLRRGPSPGVHFLLNYPGASMSKVPGGINKLLETLVKRRERVSSILFLIKHGASLFIQSQKGRYIDRILTAALHERDDKVLSALVSHCEKHKGGRAALRRLIHTDFCTAERWQIDALLHNQCISLQDVPGGIDKFVVAVYFRMGIGDKLDHLFELLDDDSDTKLTAQGHLLEVVFRKHGNVDFRVDKLRLRYGLTMRHVPCGLPRLFEEIFRSHGACAGVHYLLRQPGFDIYEVPSRSEGLLGDMFVKHGLSAEAQLLRSHGANLLFFYRYPRLLLRTYRRWGIGPEVNFLLLYGPSFKKSPPYSKETRASVPLTINACQRGLDPDSLRPLLSDEDAFTRTLKEAFRTAQLVKQIVPVAQESNDAARSKHESIGLEIKNVAGRRKSEHSDVAQDVKSEGDKRNQATNAAAAAAACAWQRKEMKP